MAMYSLSTSNVLSVLYMLALSSVHVHMLALSSVHVHMLALSSVHVCAFRKDSDSMILNSGRLRLSKEIQKHATASVRPVKDQLAAIDVKMSMNLLSIVEFNELRQHIVTSAYFELEWVDEFLQWNISDFDGVDAIRLSNAGIWKPDITLINFYEERVDLTADAFSKVFVRNDGKINWYPSRRHSSVCFVDVRFYPFDTQVCNLSFSPWDYDDQAMNLNFGNVAPFDITNYIENPEWELMDRNFEKTNTTFSGNHFTILRYNLVLRRRPTVVFLNAVLPVMMLSILNLAIFKVPRQGNDKVSYSITVFLAFAVFLSYISNTLPKNGEVTSFISVYMSVLLAMSCAIVIMTAVSMTLAQREDSPSEWFVSFLVRLKIVRPRDATRNGYSENSMTTSNNKKVHVVWSKFASWLDRVFFWLFALVLVVLNSVIGGLVYLHM